MKLIAFIGVQGSGKSTFYHRHLANTHIRLNMDRLRTSYRENLLLGALIEANQPTVIDNTNPAPEERARYIAPARAAGFEIVGYHFQSVMDDCERRDAQRDEACVVPIAGLLGTASEFSFETGRLYYVRDAPLCRG